MLTATATKASSKATRKPHCGPPIFRVPGSGAVSAGHDRAADNYVSTLDLADGRLLHRPQVVDCLAATAPAVGSGNCTGWPAAVPEGRLARQDDQLLGRSGHRDIAVYGAFDARTERLGIDEDDQIELEPLRQLRGQQPDAGRRRQRFLVDGASGDHTCDAI